MMVDIDREGLEKRAVELGDAAIAHVADVSDEEATKGYARAALDAFGHVDGFFNNAGI